MWRQLDPVLWELTHNPWAVLQTVSREKLQRENAYLQEEMRLERVMERDGVSREAALARMRNEGLMDTRVTHARATCLEKHPS